MQAFGTRLHKQVIDSLVSFRCPQCLGTTVYEYVVLREWFTVLSVPVFPISTASHSMVCPACGNVIIIDALGVPRIYAMITATRSRQEGRSSSEEYAITSQDFVKSVYSIGGSTPTDIPPSDV